MKLYIFAVVIGIALAVWVDVAANLKQENDAYQGVPLSVGNYNPHSDMATIDDIQPAARYTVQEYRELIND